MSHLDGLGLLPDGLYDYYLGQSGVVVFDDGRHKLTAYRKNGVSALVLWYKDAAKRDYEGMEAAYLEGAPGMEMSDDEMQATANSLDDQVHASFGSQSEYCLTMTATDGGTEYMYANVDATDGSSEPSFTLGDCASFH